MYGLVMVLAAAVGEVGEARSAVEPERVAAVRFHGEVSLLGAGGYATVPAAGAGGGLHLEAGLVFAGNHVVSARASFATSVVLFAMQYGLSFAERLNDRVTLGGGFTWGALFGAGDTSGALTLQVPLRFTWKFGELARRGLTVGAEVAPGLAYAGGGRGIRPTLPAPSFMAMLTLGYAVW